MEPQIQYATTADGVSIAYYTMGDGPTIVVTSNTWGSHLQLARSERARPGMEAQERRHRVVRYDGRGSGLSQRESPDFSLGARLLDLEAVVDRLGIERFAIRAWLHGGLAAVAYAVRHPERVSHLILLNPYASGRDLFASSAALRARTVLRPASNEEWELYTLTSATWGFGFSNAERAKEQASLFRTSMEPSAYLAWHDATLEIDVTGLLPEVRTPTLVLCLPMDEAAHARLSQGLAARISGARLIALEWEERLRVIEEFLGDAAPADEAGEAPKAAAATPRDETSAFRTILFTDIVGSTPLMHALGDARWRELLSEHERITREILARHAGAEIKTIGDSFMVSFGSASRAVECAIALQRAFATRNDVGAQPAAPAAEPLHVRIGVNAGEPVADSDPDGRADLFGTAVTLASRIMGEAQGGEILVSDVVRQLVAGRNFVFADRGKMLLKGFEDAVRLYELSWREDASQ